MINDYGNKMKMDRRIRLEKVALEVYKSLLTTNIDLHGAASKAELSLILAKDFIKEIDAEEKLTV